MGTRASKNVYWIYWTELLINAAPQSQCPSTDLHGVFFSTQNFASVCHIWAQAGLFAATSLILGTQYMCIERILG